jgi:DNA repair protein RadC
MELFMTQVQKSAGGLAASGSAAKSTGRRRSAHTTAAPRAPLQLASYRDVFASMSANELATIEAARSILRSHLLCAAEPSIDTPELAKQLVNLHLGGRDREVFAVVFLDQQHRFLGFEELFFGTINQTTVHPREVLRKALAYNASAVIVAHNHPSGLAEPSRMDEHLTAVLRAALSLIDVALIDHLVVGRDQIVSFAERDLLNEAGPK